MSYFFKVKISGVFRKRQPLAVDPLVDFIKENTNLNHTEAKRLVDQVKTGQEIEIRLPDSGDAEAAFVASRRIAQMGFKTTVDCRVFGLGLPYLVNAQGKVEGSENVSSQELSAETAERLLQSPEVHLIVTGYGYEVEWVEGSAKHRFWHETIKPQLIDYQNSQHRNDYPLYTATEWRAASGKSYIFIWTLH